MSLSLDEVRHIAKLARLELAAGELEATQAKLNGIFSLIEEMQAVDTDGVEPMTSVVHQGLPMREDLVTDGGDPAKVLANAPKAAKDFFVVPKVVE